MPPKGFISDDEMAALESAARPSSAPSSREALQNLAAQQLSSGLPEGFISDNDMAAMEFAQRSGTDKFNAFSASSMGGVPFGEELAARAGAGADWLGLNLRELFTGEETPSFDDLVSAQTKTYRQDAKQFDEVHPYLGFGGKVLAGGIALGPAGEFLGSGSYLAQGAKNAALGATYGLGEGERLPDRLANAMLGGMFGGAAGAATPALLDFGGFLLKSAPAQRAYHAITEPLRGETGAISIPGNVARELPRLTPGESGIANFTYQVPREKLESGLDDLTRAITEGVPLAAPEATDSAALYQLNKYLRGNDLTNDIVQDFVEPRTQATFQRVSEGLPGVFGDVPTSRLEGYTALKEGAESIIGSAKKAREAAAAPAYRAAEAARPIIDIPEVEAVMKSADVAPFLEKLKTRFPEEYGKLPENHFKLVDQAKQHLDDLIGTAKRSGANNEARLLGTMREKLLAVDELPEYKAAREIYQKESRIIARLAGEKNYNTGKREAGLITDLLSSDANRGDLKSVGAALFRKQPEQLAEIRAEFQREGVGQNLERGVRAYLEDLTEKSPLDFLKFVRGRGAARLEATIGKEKYSALRKFADQEFQIYLGDKKSFPGSPTQSLMNTAERVKGILKFVGGLFTGGIKNAPAKLADQIVGQAGKMDQATLREMAMILNDPVRGQKALQNLVQYRQIIDPRIKSVDALVEALSTNKYGRGTIGSGIGTLEE